MFPFVVVCCSHWNGAIDSLTVHIRVHILKSDSFIDSNITCFQKKFFWTWQWLGGLHALAMSSYSTD